MKRTISVLMCLAILVCSLYSFAAPVHARGVTEYFTVFNANVRNTDSLYGAVNTTLSDGSLCSSYMTWSQYVYNTTSWAYVYGDFPSGYVRHDMICPATPNCLKVIANSGVNIRSSYSASSARVGGADFNGYLQWLDGKTATGTDGYIWYNVLIRTGNYEGREGWVRSDLVRVL